jgi:UDP-MurNAc hydroxylase
MRCTRLGSATVIIETRDTKILCDPWLTDGAYYGAWCNFPPIPLEKYDFSDINYIYISHVHPDHFDPKTMEMLSKDIPVLIHRYHQKFLKFNIERLGFNVIELENGVPTSLSSTTTLSIFAADDCDPTICGHMFGCINADINGSMQLDSLCVLDDGEHILVNTNDCPFGIAERTLGRVKQLYPVIDFALIGYTSASLFPHCMMDFSAEEMRKGISRARDMGLETGLNTLKVLQPKAYMPFAGTYILGGSYHQKNKNLPLPEIQDAVAFFQSKLTADGLAANPVLLNYGQWYDIATSEVSSEYEPIDVVKREKYIKDVASKFKYAFEDHPMPDIEELDELFEASLPKLCMKQNEIGFFEDINVVFDLPDDKFMVLNLAHTTKHLCADIDDLDNYHRFQLDPRLLKLALKGPRFVNWNNIEIGALLNFSRKPDTYRMDVHTLINALHA